MHIPIPFSITTLLFLINTGEGFALLMHGNSNETILSSGLHTSDPAEIKQMFLNLTAELENLKRQIDVLGDEKKLLQNRVFFLEVELNKLNSSKTPSSNELMAYLRSTKHIIQTLAANEEYDKNLTLRLNEAENNLAICVKQNKNLTQQLNEVVNNMAANEVYDKNVSQWLGVAMDNLNDLKIQMRYTSLSLLDVHSKTEELNTTVTRNYDDRIKDLHGRITNLTKKVAFTVGMRSASSSWNSGTLVFDRIVYNIGGGYDSGTGVFTAPVNGHFVFFVNVQAYSSNAVYTHLVLNGSNKVTTMAENGSYMPGPNLAVLGLQKGDRVWVKYYAGTGYYSDSTAPATTFSGFLI